MKKLSVVEVLKYTSPIPLNVRSKDLDLLVQKSIAEAPVTTSLGMSVYTLLLSYAFYFFAICENQQWGAAWLIAHNFKFTLNIVAYFYLKRKCQNNEHGIVNTYLALFFPQILGAILWGIMPILLEDKSGLMALLCFATGCVIVYGNSSSSIGLTWLNLFFAVVAAIPTLVYAYLYTDVFFIVLVASVFYTLATWSSAHTIAYGVITSAMQRYQLLQQSELIENFLNEFQINSSDWVWETDSRNNIKFISFDIGKSEIFGRESMSDIKFMELFDPDEHNTVALNGYFENLHSFYQLVVRFQSKVVVDADRAWELRGKPVFDDTGEFKGFRGFGRDITNIQHLNKLNNAKDKFEVMSKFVAKIAHDFNNSLMVIQSSIEYLSIKEQGQLSAESKEITNSVLDVVQSAGHVNRELLSFVRQEFLNPTALDLQETLQATIKKYRIHAPNVRFELKPFENLYAFADSNGFSRTIANILMNAIEAMSHVGAISISALILDFGSGKQVAIRIEDDGPGFSQKALKNALEPFFTTKKQMGGSGLGLSTAAGFAQQSGGELIFGNMGKGAFIELRLPASLPSSKPQLYKRKIDLDLRNKRILIIDDDESVLDTLARQFGSICDFVDVASTIDGAIKLAELGKYDLLLCDFRFENDSRHGVELASQISHRYKSVIFMTGYSELADELSSYTVLPKPFSLNDFIEIYRQILEAPEVPFQRKKKETS